MKPNSLFNRLDQVRYTALGSGFAAAMAILEAQHRSVDDEYIML